MGPFFLGGRGRCSWLEGEGGKKAFLTYPAIMKLATVIPYLKNVIICINEIINKILSHDSHFIVDLVTWPKFGNSSISMREVIITSIYKNLTRKTTFLERWSWFKFSNLGLAPGMAFIFYTNVTKVLKLKIRKFGA